MILLDTSGLLAFLDSSEAEYEMVRAAFQAAGSYLTHSYVLAELVALAQARKFDRTKSIQFSIDLVNNQLAEVIWVDEGLHREALSLLQDRLDKTYSLCDAVSFILMRRYKISEALTADHHFKQEGFQMLLR